MKTKFLLLALLVAIQSFAGSSITVYSKFNKRLKAYQDSVKNYQFGLWQIKLAEAISVEDREDTAIGSKVMAKISARQKHLNPHIKPIGCRRDLLFTIRIYREVFWAETEEFWMPDIYKNPVVKIVFKDTSVVNRVTMPNAVSRSHIPSMKTANPVQAEIKPADTTKVKAQDNTVCYANKERIGDIWMPSGSKMSKEDFVARYGIECYRLITGHR